MDFYTNRRLIMSLAANDFKTKYAGSYFGIVWAFVQPVCTILVFWFVFQVGFRSADIGNVPFILWFSSGLIPWFFFSDAWNSAANAFIEYSYLVKKIVFKINILPLVKIISALFVHIFFVVFMAVIFLCYGYYPNVFWAQVPYYMFCMIILVLGLGMLTAPLMVFFRDLGQVMSIVLQFGMWLTPIMWDINRIPPQYQWIFKLNPMYYIVQGYRDSMLNGVWFYDNIKQMLYFWAATLTIVFVGSLIYRRLKPHFADVL
ncbi:MAG: ABC transporter permease [Firmicutes bacterium]|nr:ABC transporter permease [Bacillota bacterium]MBQ9604078.1 ABC transporter permease [Bacillota bacterium]